LYCEFFASYGGKNGQFYRVFGHFTQYNCSCTVYYRGKQCGKIELNSGYDGLTWLYWAKGVLAGIAFGFHLA